LSEILFTVTEENLETGMRGYPVGYCTTSTVDPYKGLFYAGLAVSEMSNWQPEEVIYLIFYGKKAEEKELQNFKKELIQRSFCSPKLISQIENFPKESHPMKLLSAALLFAGTFEGKDDYLEDSLNLIAKIPQIVATLINCHAGWGKTNPSKPEMGYMENFAQMLNVPGVSSEKLIEVFKFFNILHYDHGGGNLSAFVGKAVASGLEDLYGSMSAAMSALAGPRHGKANQDCLTFVQELNSDLGESITTDKVEQLIRDKLSKRELIYGFGHAVLRVEDARATLLYEFAQKHYADHELVKLALMLREAGSKVLKENPKVADPYPNVDAISGILLTAAGFSYPQYYTVLFGMARIVGISRQIVYERKEARESKGTPIIRPKYLYKNLSS